MNIKYIDNKIDLGSGGASHSLHLAANGLVEKGHDVEIITLGRENQNVLPVDGKYSVRYINYSNDIQGATMVYKTLKEHENGTDLFHLYNPAYIPFGGLYRKRGGDTPVVGRLNNYSLFCSNRGVMNEGCWDNCGISDKFLHDNSDAIGRVLNLPKYVFQSTLQTNFFKDIDRVFALSPAVKDIHVKNGLPNEKVDIVPNAYDERFRDNDSEGEQTITRPYHILFVGRLVHQKGADLLLKAVSEFETDVVVTIVGNGPALDHLQNLAEELNMRGDVDFPGWIDHRALPSYYHEADIFVHPGRWPEPFGRTILEAMQFNLPIVVSNVGGPPWIAEDACKVFEPGSERELSKNISDIIQNEKMYNEMRKACSRRLSSFSPSKILEEIESKYMELVRER